MSNIFYILYQSLTNDNDHDIMAISFDKKILENLIKTNYTTNYFYKLEIKENLHIFQIGLVYDTENFCDNYYVVSVVNMYGQEKNNISKNLYAFNRTKRIDNSSVYINESSIVDLSIFYDKIYKISVLKDGNISQNPIEFDKYYSCGIMCA